MHVLVRYRRLYNKYLMNKFSFNTNLLKVENNNIISAYSFENVKYKNLKTLKIGERTIIFTLYRVNFVSTIYNKKYFIKYKFRIYKGNCIKKTNKHYNSIISIRRRLKNGRIRTISLLTFKVFSPNIWNFYSLHKNTK